MTPVSSFLAPDSYFINLTLAHQPALHFPEFNSFTSPD